MRLPASASSRCSPTSTRRGAPLTRTAADLPRAAADHKVPHAAGAPWPVYLPADENRAAVAAELARALPARELARIALRPLPRELPPDFEHGLLYLPRPYVVPGGRFNEMYGWDSYFIVLGLLRDERAALARSVVDDFLYEVRHYGGVLNANRTYYLTRSQPPLLAEMVLALYHATGDRAWLARRARRADRRPRPLAGATAPDPVASACRATSITATGPAPEVVAGERDAAGADHYDRVRAWFRANPAPRPATTARIRRADAALLQGRSLDARIGVRSHRPLRSVRRRRHPLRPGLPQHPPLPDGAEPGRDRPGAGQGREATGWRGPRRAGRGSKRCCGTTAAGLYFDYDFERGRRNPYPFATTFWPLWAGVASRAHASRVRDNLPLFERPGGIVTSTTVTGAQWDAPFGWAPLQLFAVHGLHRYGFDADADRIARAWLSMLVEDFERRGTLVEKYDVERRTSEVAGKLAFGYTSNEIGFGWTNGVALELLAGLSPNASR